MSASKISKNTDEKYGSESEDEPIVVAPPKTTAPAKVPAKAPVKVVAKVVLPESDSESSDDTDDEKPEAQIIHSTASDKEDEDEEDEKRLVKKPAAQLQAEAAAAKPTQSGVHMASLVQRKAAVMARYPDDTEIAALGETFEENLAVFETLVKSGHKDRVLLGTCTMTEDVVAKMEKLAQRKTTEAAKVDVVMPDASPVASPAKGKGKGEKRPRPVSPIQTYELAEEQAEAEESSADEATVPMSRRIPPQVSADDFDLSCSQKEALEPVDADLPPFEKELASVTKDKLTALWLGQLENKRLAMKTARKEKDEVKVEALWILYEKQYKEIQGRLAPESWALRKENVNVRLAQKKDDAEKADKRRNGGTSSATPVSSPVQKPTPAPVAVAAPAPAAASSSSAPPKARVLEVNREAFRDLTVQGKKHFAETTDEEFDLFVKSVAGLLRTCACTVGNKKGVPLSKVTEMLTDLANRVDLPIAEARRLQKEEATDGTEEVYEKIEACAAAARTQSLRSQDAIYTRAVSLRPVEPTQSKKSRKD